MQISGGELRSDCVDFSTDPLPVVRREACEEIHRPLSFFSYNSTLRPVCMNKIAPDNERVYQLANRSTGVQAKNSEVRLWRNVCVSEQQPSLLQVKGALFAHLLTAAVRGNCRRRD